MPWIIQQPIENLYRRAVKGFIDDPKRFESFKRDVNYSSIIGKPANRQMYGFYNNLKQDEEVYLKLEDFADQDKIGGPWQYSFEGMKVSPNVIRYADSIRLIKKNFGTLNNKRIIEFGAGWGGLAYCIHKMWTPASYNVIDLPEPMDLQVKHSKMLGVTIEKGMPSHETDFSIAEFSLTEQMGPELYEFTKMYLFCSPEIWVRCNVFDADENKRWVKFVEEKYDIQVTREDPDYVRQNSIIVGRRK